MFISEISKKQFLTNITSDCKSGVLILLEPENITKQLLTCTTLSSDVIFIINEYSCNEYKVNYEFADVAEYYNTGNIASFGLRLNINSFVLTFTYTVSEKVHHYFNDIDNSIFSLMMYVGGKILPKKNPYENKHEQRWFYNIIPIINCYFSSKIISDITCKHVCKRVQLDSEYFSYLFDDDIAASKYKHLIKINNPKQFECLAYTVKHVLNTLNEFAETRQTESPH